MEATRYVVSRVNWRRAGDGWVRLPGEVRVASFAAAEEAAADAARREADAREQVNPFRCGPLFDLTHLPEHGLLDWLQDAGIEPPARTTGGEDWAAWWDWHTAQGNWAADQRAAVWAALDKVRFYRVEVRPAAAVVYAVVEVSWQYNDGWNDCGPEGGTVRKAYRTRERAEDECSRLNVRDRDRNARQDGDGAGFWDVAFRRHAAENPLGPVPTWEARAEALLQPGWAPFWEVVEVEVGGET